MMLRITSLALALGAASTMLVALSQPLQTRQPDLELFVQANSQLGDKLVAQMLKDSTNDNIVISPVPISVILSSLYLADSEAVREIMSVSLWTPNSLDGIPAAIRTFRARFERPPKGPVAKTPTLPSLRNPAARRPRSIWMETILQARPPAFREHIAKTMHEDFGIELKADPPETENGNRIDFKFRNRISLRSRWMFNTAMPVRASFNRPGNAPVDCSMMLTDPGEFFHVETPSYEAAVLTGAIADMLVVLPQKGHELLAVAKEVEQDRQGVWGSLTKQFGTIQLPHIRIKSRRNIKDILFRLGVRKIFDDARALAPLVRNPAGARVTDLQQQLELEVNESGIKAYAETTLEGVWGGILDGQKPFRMIADRPFLFYIRDKVTGAILFQGVLRDPTSH